MCEYFILGRRITQTIIDMGGYQSISGNYIHIDTNGDSQVIKNFALCNKSSDFFTKILIDYSCVNVKSLSIFRVTIPHLRSNHILIKMESQVTPG